jgi:hypothetical protein
LIDRRSNEWARESWGRGGVFPEKFGYYSAE